MKGSTGGRGERGRPEGEGRRGDPLGAWQEFQRIRDDIDRMIGGPFHPAPRWMDESRGFSPVVLLHETPEQLVFLVRVAEVHPDEIHVEVVGPTVHVWGYGTPTQAETDGPRACASGERGRFDVRYLLPAAAEVGGCEARFDDGFIEVRLCKASGSPSGAVAIESI